MKCNKKFSRRHVLTALGGFALAVLVFPKLAFAAAPAAKNEIVAVRTGLQSGNKTRLVIETTARAGYTLSYPEGKLVVKIDAVGRPAPKLVDGTLVSKVEFGDGEIIAHLKKTIAPIPKSQIMMFDPDGGSKYRLVLDFAAGTSTAKTAAAAEVAVAKKAAARKPVIVVDPGHGGKDPGTTGVSGTKEKEIVLTVSKKLADRLAAAGYNVHMTRRSDVYLNLQTRSGIAEKKKADLFVSVHANYNPKNTVKGFSVYTLSKNASDAEAQKLAENENAADKIDVDGFKEYEPAVRSALSALQQRMVDEESIMFARSVIKSTRAAGVAAVDKSHRSADFSVLRSTVPSCLVELGHMSHKDEEKLLKSAAHQDKLVGALVTAIGNYDFISE